MELVLKRPSGKPLITVTNHDSCCDDPLVFGATLPLKCYLNAGGPKMRWSLGAREICHSNPTHALFFRLGQVLPVVRGGGIYQPIMNDMLEKLNEGDWLHIFPEGKVNEKKEQIRFKWGVGRLIADCKITPIVLPFYNYGMDSILPNKQPYRPQYFQKATIVVGTPIYFDDLVKKLREEKASAAEMRKIITDKIQEEMYKLKVYGQQFHEQHLKGAS